jgi:DNA replication ATP-dependent helicase Dna2
VIIENKVSEASVVENITSSYFLTLKETEKKQKLFIVTPYHRQRLEITLRLKKYLKNDDLQINTIDKIQGQEADIVIACFGFFNTSQQSQFIYDMNRWNVALSRAKSKLIIITTNEMLDPDDMEIFANKKICGGLKYLHMIKNWAQEKSAIVKLVSTGR